MDMTFFRAALLGACVLLSGCDSATTPATPAATATVLDGKTMGTFWRVSVIGVDEAKAQALRAKVQAQLDADDRLLSTWKNDSALMRFNHAATTEPWPVSEAMADIVTLSLRIGAKTHGAMDITVGPLVNLWGFGPDKQPVTTPDAEAIAAAKARTGLQHLQVINQSGRQFLQKRYSRSVCRPLHRGGRLCRRPPRAVDGAGGDLPAIWCRWAGRWSAAG